MADIDILQLPVAVAVDGSEYIGPMVQGGTDKRVRTGLFLAGSAPQSVQTANTVFAGPASGAADAPAFRTLVGNDIQPALDDIGATQGSVLYRGASDWSALAPGTSGYVLSTQGAGADPQWISNTAGSVTSVGLSLPGSVFSVSGSPVTTTGTLTGSFTTQTANTAFLGPTSGAAATPAFRTLVAADLPQGTSGYALIGNGASASSYQGYTPSGSGAITTTWQTQLRKIKFISDYGTAAQAATAAANDILFVKEGESVTVTVAASGGDYTTIALALSAIQDWIIAGTVTISVANGTYTLSPLTWSHPFSRNLRLRSVGGLASSVVLQVSTTNTTAIYVGANQHLNVDGFTVQHTTIGNIAGTIGMIADEGGYIISGAAMIVEGFYQNIFARRGGIIRCITGGIYRNGGDTNALALAGTIDLAGASFTGANDPASTLGSGAVVEGGALFSTGAILTGNDRAGIHLISGYVRLTGADTSSNTNDGILQEGGVLDFAAACTSGGNGGYGYKQSNGSTGVVLSLANLANGGAGANGSGLYRSYVSNFFSAQPGTQVVSPNTNESRRYDSKGTGSHFFNTGNGLQFAIDDAATAVNRLRVYGAASGSGPTIEADGSDADVNIRLLAQGAGHVEAASNILLSAADPRIIWNAGGNYIRAPAASTFALGSASSDLLIFDMTGAVYPQTSDALALGSTTRMWSDLFLASGGVINWANGGATITESAAALAFAGAANGYSFDAQILASVAGNAGRFVNTTNSADVLALRVEGDRATPTTADIVRMSMYLSNASGTQTPFSSISTYGETLTAGAEFAQMRFAIQVSGALTNKMTLGNSYFIPAANDGLTLGLGTLAWADLFLASGGVINWNNGTFTLTQSGSTLTSSGTIATADLTVTNAPRINQAPTAIGTGVKTISNAADSSTNFGHYLQLNLNGTTYYIPCGSVAPT